MATCRCGPGSVRPISSSIQATPHVSPISRNRARLSDRQVAARACSPSESNTFPSPRSTRPVPRLSPSLREPPEGSLALYRRLGDTRGTGRVLRGLGDVFDSLGEQARAATCRSESLALFREIGDTWGVAWMLLEIGRTAPGPQRQVAMLEQSLALARARGYKRTIATALGNLGKLAHGQGQYARASQLLEECLAIGRELRDNWIVAWMLSELGRLARDQGDVARARERFGA